MIERSPASFRSRATAFSLVELVAALSLAALLTIAVLSAMRTMANAYPTTARMSASPMADDRLANLLRFDLAQASSFRQADSALYLAGYNSLQRDTFAPTHRPVLVCYRLRKVGGHDWLIREQSALDVLSTTGSWSEFVAADRAVPAMTAVAVTPIIAVDEADASGSSRRPPADAMPAVFAQLHMLPMPPAVRVEISNAAGGAMVFTQVLR